jgi:lipopolysaccharide biosynthesis protein
MGRYDESIANYRKALAIDGNFIASYIGIGNDQMFMDKGSDARATFAKLTSVARNDLEKRTGMFWTAMSFVHEGAPDKALAEVERMSAIAEINADKPNMAADLNLMGTILLEAGRADEAERRYADLMRLMEEAAVPAEVKEAARRNALFNQARVAIVKGDLATAHARAAEFARQVAVKANPVEVRQTHELEGRIALAEKNGAKAIAELRQANQQDPAVLYQEAAALQAQGDPGAKAAFQNVASFNALFPTYAYVRTKAKAALVKG